MVRNARHVLVAEDDPQVQRCLVRSLSSWGYDVAAHASYASVARALDPAPDLVLLDVWLEDGAAIEVARVMAELKPSPEVIVMSGAATPSEAFRFSQFGARAYLQKPFTPTELRTTINRVLSSPPDFEAHVRHAVPWLGLREISERSRNAAYDQGLALEDGNRSGAARVLRVSRQAVQRNLRERAKR